ncbi:TPA: hypothetical protein ACQMY0_001439, partial [Streptococcus pyogenes]
HNLTAQEQSQGFGTIQNSIALKHNLSVGCCGQSFWDHSKQHSSKTFDDFELLGSMFWDHSKQHSSKTS